MAYSEFTLAEALRRFSLSRRTAPLFAAVVPVEPTDFLQTQLEEGADYALRQNTEKVRSELVIMPILMEVRRQLQGQITVFSGKDFVVEPENGLTGFCDYLVTGTDDSLLIEAPVLAVVEAKKENIPGGYGQCIAEMEAAHRFNDAAGTPRPVIYGAVTTGDIWSFLSLENRVVLIDDEFYYIDRVERILGILLQILRQ
jgi:hypothetical protein